MARATRSNWSYLILLILALAFWYWRHRPPSSESGGSALGPHQALETLDGCGLEGDATNPEVRELNRLKNRTAVPEPQQIDSRVTLAAMVEPGDDQDRWNARNGAEITGYVQDVKVGGVETVNCRATDPQHRDTHIELVLDPMNSGETRRVIVEVTPRTRALAEQRGEDWSTNALRDHLQGRWVRVRGWMLFDEEHRTQAVNTAPGRPRDWRATAWEIHPVTSLEVVQRP
jgi:hypothetical protein